VKTVVRTLTNLKLNSGRRTNQANGVERVRVIEWLRTLAGLAQSEDDQRADDFLLLRAGMGRPFVVAPGVPTERVAALREAFAAALHDPELIEESKKLRLNISHVPPDILQGLVEKAYGADAQTLERVRKAMR
jgi:hypothetical protein